MLIPRCCFAQDGGETNQVVVCTCDFIIVLLFGGVLHDVAVVVFLNNKNKLYLFTFKRNKITNADQQQIAELIEAGIMNSLFPGS